MKLSLKSVFPSGGQKIIKNYVEYKNATNFGTRMKYISLFKNDLKALEHDGVLRNYMESMNILDEELKAEISQRISNLKSTKKDKPGTIEKDLSQIQDPELKKYYNSLR